MIVHPKAPEAHPGVLLEVEDRESPPGAPQDPEVAVEAPEKRVVASLKRSFARIGYRANALEVKRAHMRMESTRLEQSVIPQLILVVNSASILQGVKQT